MLLLLLAVPRVGLGRVVLSELPLAKRVRSLTRTFALVLSRTCTFTLALAPTLALPLALILTTSPFFPRPRRVRTR